MNEPEFTKRNGFELGDAVRLPCINATLEVIGLEDPSLVKLRTADGRVITAGWRVITKVPSKRLAAS